MLDVLTCILEEAQFSFPPSILSSPLLNLLSSDYQLCPYSWPTALKSSSLKSKGKINNALPQSVWPSLASVTCTPNHLAAVALPALPTASLHSVVFSIPKATSLQSDWVMG